MRRHSYCSCRPSIAFGSHGYPVSDLRKRQGSACNGLHSLQQAFHQRCSEECRRLFLRRSKKRRPDFRRGSPPEPGLCRPACRAQSLTLDTHVCLHTAPPNATATPGQILLLPCFLLFTSWAPAGSGCRLAPGVFLWRSLTPAAARPCSYRYEAELRRSDLVVHLLKELLENMFHVISPDRIARAYMLMLLAWRNSWTGLAT